MEIEGFRLENRMKLFDNSALSAGVPFRDIERVMPFSVQASRLACRQIPGRCVKALEVAQVDEVCRAQSPYPFSSML